VDTHEIVVEDGLPGGGDSGGLRDKSTREQEKHAEMYYESIRNRKSKSDIQKIAKYTEFSEEQISAIRDHIFINEHDMGDGMKERFYPDYRMAQAWQRLEQGQGTQEDMLLLHHEFFELTIMRKHGYNYGRAHPMANEKYPWYAKQVASEGENDVV